MFNICIKDSKGKLLDTIPCDQRTCSIGRSGKNFVQLKGWRIAGTHAEFIVKADGIHIADLSGGIGTAVNGEEIESFGPLSVDDEVNIGNYRLSVRQDNAQATPVSGESQANLADTPLKPDPVFEEVQLADTREASEPLARDMIGVRNYSGEVVGNDKQKDRFIWNKRIHDRLMEAMDIRRTDVASMNDVQLTETVASLIREIIAGMDQELPRTWREID